MPAGWERLNVKTSQPNPNVVFIKPLKGPDERIAQDFLERIAAQCRPIMREHHLYVTSLEEYEPNREFVGRNFNAGEVVQLVLKSPRTGRWLPFNYVQMVMMHELAHCKQMNHSRAFWAVRNGYAAEMQALWAKGYAGDGLWGRGAKLATGEWERNTVLADEILPEHLCGGTYRSRGRKRKAKPTLTYQERKEKRILKKFGKNGVALGSDEDAKVKLESGKKVQGKPRVAKSARGRELRAAAALARFEQQKQEERVPVKDEDETESGSESEYEDVDGADGDTKDAVDINGSLLVDSNGRGMIKVCEDEDASDPGAKNELDELENMLRNIKTEPGESEEQSLGSIALAAEPKNGPDVAGSESSTRADRLIKMESNDGASMLASQCPSTTWPKQPEPASTRLGPLNRQVDVASSMKADESSEPDRSTTADTVSCSMCSFANPQLSVTCNICGNVLEPSKTVNSWNCQSDTCKDNQYYNSGDCGLCSICGCKNIN